MWPLLPPLPKNPLVGGSEVLNDPTPDVGLKLQLITASTIYPIKSEASSKGAGATTGLVYLRPADNNKPQLNSSKRPAH